MVELIEGLTGQSILIVGIVALVVLYFLAKAVKTIFKLVIWAAVIFALIYFFTGNNISGFLNPKLENIFKDTSITKLYNEQCKAGKSDKIKCSCFIVPVYGDMSQRFTNAELAEIEADKSLMLTEAKKSLKNKKEDIEACLKTKKEGGEEFFNQFKQFLDRFKVVEQNGISN